MKRCKVGHGSNYIYILPVLLQGDTLAPYVFTIALGCALRQAIEYKEEALGFQLKRKQSRRIRLECVTDLDFADNIALISEEIKKHSIC